MTDPIFSGLVLMFFLFIYLLNFYVAHFPIRWLWATFFYLLQGIWKCI